jgi:stress response protein YsnF
MRVEGDTTIIPVVEEIVVVEKRLVLVEEVRIRQITTSEDVTVPVTLRRQTATVERVEE